MSDTQHITGADLLSRYPKGVRMIQIAYKQVSGQPFDRNGVVAPDILAQLDAKYLPGASKAPAQKRRATVRNFRQVEVQKCGYVSECGRCENGVINNGEICPQCKGAGYNPLNEFAQHVTFSRNETPVISQPAAAQVSQPEIAPEQGSEQVAQVSRNWRDWLSDAICICIVVFHAGLIAYDCAKMWDTPGAIGGVIAFMVQCLALLYSTDPNKTRTSETALFVVAGVDFLAWFVHYPTFADNAAHTASDIVTGVLCGVLCVFSFVASFLYRDSKII